MVNVVKSQPAPAILAQEKKPNGNYRRQEILDQIKVDFRNKCYICEYKEPATINVEHFIPHREDINIKFDWNNLFLACGHCNNTKSDKYDDILNCTLPTDNVETALEYHIDPFPKEKVEIRVVNDTQKAQSTRLLLLEVYNGSTPLKVIESSNLRNKLLAEIFEFQKLLIEYFEDTISDEYKQSLRHQISKKLHPASNFAAFKRWKVRKSTELRSEFGDLLVG